MNASDELVFVYGTLRRGGSNHFRMDGAEFVGFGSIRGRIYRFDWYPGLVVDDSGDEIIGEVYAVSPQQMTDLDFFEGISAGEIEGSEYRRTRVKVSGCGDPLEAWVWEWRGLVDESRRIESGDWLTAVED